MTMLFTFLVPFTISGFIYYFIKEHKKQKYNLLYIILVFICLIPIIPYPIGAFSSLFLFDSPHKSKVLAYLMFAILWTYPILLYVGAYFSMKLYEKNKIFSYLILPSLVVILFYSMKLINYLA